MMLLRNVKLAGKLMILSGILLGFLLAIAATALWGFSTQYAQMQQVSAKQLAIYRTSVQLELAALDIKATMYATASWKAVAFYADDKLAQIGQEQQARLKEFQQQVGDMFQTQGVYDEEELAIIGNIHLLLTEFKNYAEQAFTSIVADAKLGAYMAAQATDTSLKLQTVIESLVRLEEKRIDEATGIVKDTYERGSLQLIILSLVALALGILFSLLLARSISGPLGQTVEILGSFAEGDFRRQLGQGARDEAGMLAGHIQGVRSSMHKIIGEIKKISDQASALSLQLASATTESSASFEEIRANIENMAHKLQVLDEMAVTSGTAVSDFEAFVRTVMALIDKEVGIIGSSRELFETMIGDFEALSSLTSAKMVVVRELETTSGEGRQEMESTQELIRTVVESASVIGEMAEVIKRIASQTSLLAMNAAIEAAHAGEFGKGFAVVAGEVQALSLDTQESSRQIEESLGSVVTNIRLAEEATAKSADYFNRIVDGVVIVGTVMHDVDRRSAELASSGAAVRSALQELSATTEQVRDTSVQIGSRILPLRAAVTQVGNIASESRNGIEEVAMGINDISEAFIAITNEGQNNATTVQSLVDIVNTFKLGDGQTT